MVTDMRQAGRLLTQTACETLALAFCSCAAFTRTMGRQQVVEGIPRERTYRYRESVPDASGQHLTFSCLRKVDVARLVNYEVATYNNPSGLGRASHGAVVFANRIWVLGGEGDQGLLQDVWYSSDGFAWHEASAAEWSAREGMGVVVHDGSIWIMGGGGEAGDLNDVWRWPPAGWRR